MKKLKLLLYFLLLAITFGLPNSVSNRAYGEVIICQLISTKECHRVCSATPLGIICDIHLGLKYVPKNHE